MCRRSWITTSGTATGGSTADNVLEDTVQTFPSLAEANRPDVGNLLVNKTDDTRCMITSVGDSTLTCAPGSGMSWDATDAYEVVGDGTKDLIVRLGVGFCSGGGAGFDEFGIQVRPAAESDVSAIHIGHQFPKTVFADALPDGAADTAGQIQFAVGKRACPAPTRGQIRAVAAFADWTALEHDDLGRRGPIQDFELLKNTGRAGTHDGDIETVVGRGVQAHKTSSMVAVVAEKSQRRQSVGEWEIGIRKALRLVLRQAQDRRGLAQGILFYKIIA